MNSKCCVQLFGFTSVPVPLTLDRIYLQEDKFYHYSNIRHYVAMGFSFNDIDMPYIEKMWSINRQKEAADWTLYWYSSGEDNLMKKKLIELGVNEKSITTLKWE